MECKLFPVERVDCLSLQDAKQNSGWNITAFDLPDAWKHTQGEGIKIAVLDTGCDLDHPDLIGNLLPGKNFAEPGKPPQDRNGHGCVSSDSLVHTNFCGIEKIEILYDRISKSAVYEENSKSWIKDVRNLGINTHSLNSNSGLSEISEVEFLHKTKIDDEIIKITLEGNTEFKLTGWHPVYVIETSAGGRNKIVKKRADELTKKHRFIFPSKNEGLVKDLKKVFGEHYYECENCYYIPKNLKNRHPKSKCKKCFKNSWIKKQRNYFLNEDLAYILGIVLTDGHIVHKKNYRVEIASETIEILNKSLECLERLGFNSRIDYPKDRCARLLCNSKELVILLENIGLNSGCKTYTQSLPEIIGKSTNHVIYSFVAGVIDGDGCISSSNTKNRIITANKEFAVKMSALLNSIGISSGVQKCKNSHYSKNRDNELSVKLSHLYHISFSSICENIVKRLSHPKKIERGKIVPKFNRTSRKIKTIEKIRVNEYFYDFTVKDNHTYVANGHYVSNTHVIGTICAMNNDIGVVGVAPKAKIMPVKVLGDDGNGNLLNVAKGIRWAADQGVDFISMSLGAPVAVQQVRKAIQYAATKGAVCFVAAGNAGDTKEVFYPANYPETIAIGAINNRMDRAVFSNTGRNLDFMAPGVDIFSTVPDNWYATLSGTSMAQPFACGVAALLKSYIKNNPKLNKKIKLETAEDYRGRFKKHVVPVSSEKYKDKKFYQGFGIIDPRLFVEAIDQFEKNNPQPKKDIRFLMMPH